MNKVVMSPDQLYNCPICGVPCQVDEVRGWETQLRVQGACQVFLCINPLVDNPLHYYTHVVEKSVPHQVGYQEFSLDLGHRHVIVANNFLTQQTLIKTGRDAPPLTLGFILSPDFPYLSSLKKKVRTSITFA